MSGSYRAKIAAVLRKGSELMKEANKGDWVQIFKIVLQPNDRAPGLPAETAAVPLTMKVKGFLKNNSARLGDAVMIETITGRVTEGEMIAVNPVYDINYGAPQQDLLQVGIEARLALKGGKNSQ